MKHRFCSMVAVIALALLATVPAWTQLTGTRFTVSLNFQVGKHQLPSGEYRVSAVNEKTLLISRINGAEAVVVMTKAPVHNPRGTAARLVFTCYGNDSFLSQAWLNGESGWELPKSSEETEHARIMQQKVAIIYSMNR